MRAAPNTAASFRRSVLPLRPPPAGSDLAPPRERGEVLAGPVGQGLDRRRGLAPATGDEARAVADEEIPHVVRAVIAVHDRGPRVVAHAARTQEVGREVRLLH